MFRSSTFSLPFLSSCLFFGAVSGHAAYQDGDNFETGVTSANNMFTVNFYYLYAGEHFDMNSGFRKGFQDSIIRALNTIEKTFVPKSTEAMEYSQGIHLSVHLYLDPLGTQGASSLPYSGSSNKTTWDHTDFGGKFAGQGASVNNVEALYKYGQKLDQNPWRVDGGLSFISISETFNYFYVGEDPAGIQSHQRDLESLTLHEMGHILGFNLGGNGTKSALELFTQAEQGEYSTKWRFRGDTVMELTNGQGIELMSGGSQPDSHINPGLNNPYPYTMVSGIDAPVGSTRRAYSERELAMFKDMGWTLANDPFESVPEPASTLLGAAGLGFFLSRRRR